MKHFFQNTADIVTGNTKKPMSNNHLGLIFLRHMHLYLYFCLTVLTKLCVILNILLFTRVFILCICTCIILQNGEEQCHTIRCNPPDCTNPHTPPGECCPTCICKLTQI